MTKVPKDWTLVWYIETFLGFTLLALGVNTFLDATVFGGNLIFPTALLIAGAWMSSRGAERIIAAPLMKGKKTVYTWNRVFSHIFWLIFICLIGFVLIYLLIIKRI